MHEESLKIVEDFLEALRRNVPRFGVELSAEASVRLADYFRIVMAWNPRLHLVAPCTPLEFATRHVLESLTALPFLSDEARVTDIGSGAGLPLIPCLAVRTDLQATLIEANAKKAVFLREALRAIAATARTQVMAKRFEDVEAPPADFITCRALERLTEKFKEIVAWAQPSAMLLFFGGPALEEEIERVKLSYQKILIPTSERRFLFIIERKEASRD